MWMAPDGRYCTVSLPTDVIEAALPAGVRIDRDLADLADADDWYTDDVFDPDALLASLSSVFDLREEAPYVDVAIPLEFIERFPWLTIIDRATAIKALGQLPVRWRLDMAGVIEALAWRSAP